MAKRRDDKLLKDSMQLLFGVMHRFEIVYVDDRPADMACGRTLRPRIYERYARVFRQGVAARAISKRNLDISREVLEGWADQPTIVREACKTAVQMLEAHLRTLDATK